MKIMQKMVDNTRNEKQKAMFQNCLQNARQMLANFREVERILANGRNGHYNK